MRAGSGCRGPRALLCESAGIGGACLRGGGGGCGSAGALERGFGVMGREEWEQAGVTGRKGRDGMRGLSVLCFNNHTGLEVCHCDMWCGDQGMLISDPGWCCADDAGSVYVWRHCLTLLPAMTLYGMESVTKRRYLIVFIFVRCSLRSLITLAYRVVSCRVPVTPRCAKAASRQLQQATIKMP